MFHRKINVQENKYFQGQFILVTCIRAIKKEFKNSFHISLASETPTELPVITNVHDSGSFHDLFPPPIVYTRCHHDDISSSPIYWLQCGEIERWDIFSQKFPRPPVTCCDNLQRNRNDKDHITFVRNDNDICSDCQN